MGRIAAPYAVKGWVKVQPFTECIDGLLDYPEWQVGRGVHWQSRHLAEGKLHGQVLLAKLEGIEDRVAAESLVGQEIAVSRNELPEPDENEYYWDRLVDLMVVNPRGTLLGRITGFLESGAHDILRVQGEDGVERLIPFVAAIVLNVDEVAGRVTVEWEADY